MLGLDSDENSWADYAEVMPHVREHKLVAPEGQGAAVLIHCKIVILLDLCAVRLANPKSITISDSSSIIPVDHRRPRLEQSELEDCEVGCPSSLRPGDIYTHW